MERGGLALVTWLGMGGAQVGEGGAKEGGGFVGAVMGVW